MKRWNKPVAAAALFVLAAFAHADSVGDARALVTAAEAELTTTSMKDAAAEFNAGGEWRTGKAYVVLVGFDGRPEQATKVLREESVVNSLESTEDGGLRLYVTDGATAIPTILRALDAGGVPLRSIELHRPSLDDVFLTKTGRSLRES